MVDHNVMFHCAMEFSQIKRVWFVQAEDHVFYLMCVLVALVDMVEVYVSPQSVMEFLPMIPPSVTPEECV
jgi:hypothetical protein